MKLFLDWEFYSSTYNDILQVQITSGFYSKSFVKTDSEQDMSGIRAVEVLWDETGNVVAWHFGGQGSRRQSHCQS